MLLPLRVHWLSHQWKMTHVFHAQMVQIIFLLGLTVHGWHYKIETDGTILLNFSRKMSKHWFFISAITLKIVN